MPIIPTPPHPPPLIRPSHLPRSSPHLTTTPSSHQLCNSHLILIPFLFSSLLFCFHDSSGNQLRRSNDDGVIIGLGNRSQGDHPPSNHAYHLIHPLIHTLSYIHPLIYTLSYLLSYTHSHTPSHIYTLSYTPTSQLLLLLHATFVVVVVYIPSHIHSHM